MPVVVNKVCVGLSLVRGTFQYGRSTLSLITFVITLRICQWRYLYLDCTIDLYTLPLLLLSLRSVYQTQTLTSRVNVDYDEPQKSLCFRHRLLVVVILKSITCESLTACFRKPRSPELAKKIDSN